MKQIKSNKQVKKISPSPAPSHDDESLSSPSHEQNCFTWASSRTEVLPSLPPEQNCYLALPTKGTVILQSPWRRGGAGYFVLFVFLVFLSFKYSEKPPHEENCFTWASPRTELLPSLPHEQNCNPAFPTNRIATSAFPTNRIAAYAFQRNIIHVDSIEF